MKRQIAKPEPILYDFENFVSGERFEAFLVGQEDIEGKSFYVLRLKNHPRVVKIATSAVKKTKIPVDKSTKTL